MEDSVIVVDGLPIDTEQTRHVWAKYYEHCCSRKSLLHKELLRVLNCKLAAGIISETMIIADAIRASNITTSIEAFMDLGIAVGFVQPRLNQLTDLAIKSKRMEDAGRERTVAEKEPRVLEAKALDVRSTISKLDAEIKILDKNGNKDVMDVSWTLCCTLVARKYQGSCPVHFAS